MFCAGNNFAMFYEVARKIRVDPVEVVPASFRETIGDSEGLNFSVTPGKHHLAANAILELALVLDDENPGALFRHVFCQCCAAHATTCDGNIVRCRHASSSQGIS
jgi:hypothetical protein